jgi:hypothetical protein
MGTPAAPRIDDRLRRYIAGSSFFDTPAETTRAAGELAWALGLPRPSYEQVRALMRACAPKARAIRRVVRLLLRVVRIVLGVGRSMFRRRRRPAGSVTVCYEHGPPPGGDRWVLQRDRG